nr:Binding protein, putative isoform 1 [Ipomoea batatas]
MEIGSESNKMKVQNTKRKYKLEFLGWSWKPLIEFLDSIGKESRQYSQGEVGAIMKKLCFFQSVVFCLRKVKGEAVTRAWVARIAPGWARAFTCPLTY